MNLGREVAELRLRLEFPEYTAAGLPTGFLTSRSVSSDCSGQAGSGLDCVNVEWNWASRQSPVFGLHCTKHHLEGGGLAREPGNFIGGEDEQRASDES